jgi:hypothetical protein
MSCHIFAYEVVDNGRLKEFSLVGYYVLNPQATTQVACIVEIVGAIILLVETEGYTHNLVSGIL